MRTRYRIVLVTLACLLFLLASVPTVAEERRLRGVLKGRVVEVSDEEVVLKVPGASWRVPTGADCLFWAPEKRDARLEDWSPGEAVLALGRRGRDGSFTPRLAVVASPAWLRRHALSGTVKGVKGPSVVVSSPSGERVLRPDDECRLRIAGSEDGSWEDIGESHCVVALGTHNEAGEFVARALIAYPATRSSRALLAGLVVDSDGEYVTVQGVSRRVAVSVDGDTQWWAFGGGEPGLSDVRVDDYLAVVASRNEEGRVRAQTVASLPRKAMTADYVRGEVVGIEVDGFIVDTPGGRVRVLVSESTGFRSRGQRASGLLDMAPGDRVIIVGRRVNEHALEARLIGLVGGMRDSRDERSRR